jgi:hypothetical protein
MLTHQEIQIIMDVISNRTKQFLQTQINLDVDQTQFYQSHVAALKLRHLTSLMSLGGNVDIYLAYSFEQELIHYIFGIYTQGIDISTDEQEQYEAETAGDIINIILNP